MRLRDPIWRFALRVLAWLVPCFAAWYAIAPWYDRPAAWLARILLDLWHDGLVDAMELQARLVTYVTSLQVTEGGRTGNLVLEVNPLLYGYGVPLLAALLLASGARWTRLVLGAAILLPFQAWGIAFDALAQILRSTPALAAQAGLQGMRGEVAAVAYQLGSLILPALVPLALWTAWQRAFLEGVLLRPER
ncbi:MAG TPA: exosortase H-associated membrane protein [Usitatibacter sp.]|nr:exosortase H-associated membrane protein [Usitatibacter sp.]